MTDAEAAVETARAARDAAQTTPEAIDPQPTQAQPTTRRELRDTRARPRLSRRARTLLIIGGTVVVVLALIAGLLIATTVNERATADGLRSAEKSSAEAKAALDDAITRIDDAAAALDELVTATDAALAITGAGLDEAARPVLQEARDAAGEVQQSDGSEVQGLYGDQLVTIPQGDDRAAADAHRRQAELYTDDAALASDRADRLEEAVGTLGEAVTAYLAAAQTVGAALLADRADASDDVKATLQSQLDALTDSTPASAAETLTAYRAAVDAMLASSDAARQPATPGGTGIRITDPSSLTVVVNKQRGLTADYVPPGLQTPQNIPGATQVRSELIGPLEQMRADMAAAGITLRMSSAYRSYARQQTIYNGFVASEGVAGADTHSARPGNSEHQTGLAVDLDDGTGCNLNTCFANTPGGRWLAENSWKYGFILRYGDGWQPIVGYSYEPWHFRYIGVEIATDMHDRGIRTLEEYYGLPAAPDYG